MLKRFSISKYLSSIINGSKPSEIQRFRKIQDDTVQGTKLTYFELAMKELKDGRKSSHWIWFIFPQIDG
jgi:uncharacterized protein (DUF1810 family)